MPQSRVWRNLFSKICDKKSGEPDCLPKICAQVYCHAYLGRPDNVSRAKNPAVRTNGDPDLPGNISGSNPVPLTMRRDRKDCIKAALGETALMGGEKHCLKVNHLRRYCRFRYGKMVGSILAQRSIQYWAKSTKTRGASCSLHQKAWAGEVPSMQSYGAIIR